MATSSGGPSLRVRISADLDDIKQGLGLLRGELAKVRADASKVAPDTTGWTRGVQALRQQVVGLAGAYIGLNAAAAGVRALFSALDNADRLNDVSAQVNLSVESLSKLGYAAKLSGSDQETLNKGLVAFNKNLRENSPLLRQLGVDTSTVETALDGVADVFAQLPEGPERTELAVRLFGRAGAELIPLLQVGSVGLREFGDEAQRVGAVVSTEAAASAAEFNDKMDRLQASLRGVALVVAQQLLPVLNHFAGGAEGAATNMDAAAKVGGVLATVLKGVYSAAVVVSAAFNTWVITLAAVADALGATGSALKKFFTGQYTQADADALRARFSGIREAAATGIEAEFDSVRRLAALWDDTAASAAKAGTATAAAAGKARRSVDNRLAAKLRQLLGGDEKKTPTRDPRFIDPTADSTVLAQDAVKRSLAELQQAYEAGDLSAQQYFSRRLELQRAALDLQEKDLRSQQAGLDAREQWARQLTDAERKEAELASIQEKRTALEEKLVILGRDRVGIASDATREQSLAESRANAQLEGDVAQFQSGLGGVGLDPFEAEEQRINASYIRQLEQLDEFRRQRADLNARWDLLETQARQDHARALELLEQQKMQLVSAQASQGFAALASIAKAYGGEQSKTYRALFAASKAFAVAQAAVDLAQNVSKAMSYGFPQNIPFIASAFAQGAQIAQLLSAAQYADGGRISGPGTGTSDSVPIWASNGEFVLREAVTSQPGMLPFLEDLNRRGLAAVAPPRAYAEGGLVTSAAVQAAVARGEAGAGMQAAAAPAAGTSTRIVNVIDPNLVGDYMTTASGERTILNVIERNAGAIRQKLA